MMEKLKVLIADDQQKVRFALRVTLERQNGLSIIGEASDAIDMLTQLKSLRPNVSCRKRPSSPCPAVRRISAWPSDLAPTVSSTKAPRRRLCCRQ
jgi:hypothetical protein